MFDAKPVSTDEPPPVGRERSTSKFGSFVSKKGGALASMTRKRFAFDGELQVAVDTLEALTYPDFALTQKEKTIPFRILKDASGLVFMTEVKAGFLFSGKGGTGLVIKRLPDGKWSGPSLFGFAGVGAGLMVGMSKTNTLICLNSAEAVKTFEGKGQVKLGADFEVAAGPVGRHAGGAANVGKSGVAPSLAYSHSKGLYAGLSIDGTVLIPRHKDNAAFYGRPVTTEEILEGEVRPPDSMVLKDLYALLKRVEKEGRATARMNDISSSVPSFTATSLAAKAAMS